MLQMDSLRDSLVNRLSMKYHCMRDMFRTFDNNNDGIVSVDDIQKTLRKMNITLSKNEVKNMLGENSNDTIKFVEFSKQFSPKNNRTNSSSLPDDTKRSVTPQPPAHQSRDSSLSPGRTSRYGSPYRYRTSGDIIAWR